MPLSSRDLTSSPFAAVARGFAALTTGSWPLSLDTTSVDGLPDRPVPLDELKTRLLHPACHYETRDAAVLLLIDRAQRDGDWAVGLIGVLLPGLRRAAIPLLATCPARAADLEAEMLAGVLAAVRGCPPGRRRPAGWLIGRGYDAGKRLLRAELAERARPSDTHDDLRGDTGHDPAVDLAGPSDGGHPDLLLAGAVQAGVLCADDAELIGASRIGRAPLAEVAADWGLSYAAASKRRHRAEAALVGWLRGGFVAPPGRAAGSAVAGRPRQGHRPDQRPGPRPPSEPTTSPRR